jgi:predicted DNA-binding protein (MmcQ/YjbR family)
MFLDEIREYCLSKKGVEEGFPFGGDTLVFKVMGKMFLLTGIDSSQFSLTQNVILKSNRVKREFLLRYSGLSHE